jgi:hypothetical protein
MTWYGRQTKWLHSSPSFNGLYKRGGVVAGYCTHRLVILVQPSPYRVDMLDQQKEAQISISRRTFRSEKCRKYELRTDK